MISTGPSLLAALLLLVCSNLASFAEYYNKATRPISGHLHRLPQGIGKDWHLEYFELYRKGEIAGAEGKTTLKLGKDGWRKYSPTSDYCVGYLKKFIDRNYKLEFMLEIIQLDICLGYLYDHHENRWTDQASTDGKNTLENLISDEKLEKIYQGTKLELLDPEGVQFLRKFFDYAFAQAWHDKTESCSLTTWIRAVELYAEGHQSLGDPTEDTYVDLLSDVARRFGQKCFKELAQFYSRGTQFEKFDTHVLPNLKNLIPSPARRQLVENHWPEELLKVFQKSLGISKSTAIDFDQLQSFAYRLKDNDPIALGRLLLYLEGYAKSKLNNPIDMTQGEANIAYTKLKGDLCLRYISSPMKTWIKLTSYPKFFGDLEWVLFRNNDKFFGEKIRTMYLATFMCRYIDQTFATHTGDKYCLSYKDTTEQDLRIWPMQPPQTNKSIEKT